MSTISRDIFIANMSDKLAVANPARIGLATMYRKMGLKGQALKGAVLAAERNALNGDSLLKAKLSQYFQEPVMGNYLNTRVKNYLDLYGRGNWKAANKVYDELRPYADYFYQNFKIMGDGSSKVLEPATIHFMKWNPDSMLKGLRQYVL